MPTLKFERVTAIHGTADYADTVTHGYAVRDENGRHYGYVAKVGNVWQHVRPARFGGFLGFHAERYGLRGRHETRKEAAAWLEYQAAEADMLADAAGRI